MVKNYLTVAFRGFWRNKVFSLIHVLGLSIGISASLVIYLIVRHELSFDRFEPDSERIYRVAMDFNFNGDDGHSAAVPAPLAGAVQAEVSGVQAIVPVMQFQGDATVKVSIFRDASCKPEVFKKQPDVIFTTPDYFFMLPHAWLAGSPLASLQEPFSVVITESRTRQYFPAVALTDLVGASVTSILSILSVEFIQLVLIAFAIAAPVAGWAIDRWLQTFAYRTSMSWWAFAVSGLFLMVAAMITLSAQVIKTATTNPVKSLRTE